MRRIAPSTALQLIVDILLLAACVHHFPYLVHRSDLPFTVSRVEGRLTVVEVTDSAAAAGVRVGDLLTLPDPQFAVGYHGLEYYTDFCMPGDTMTVTVERSGVPAICSVRLVSYYTTAGIIMFAIVSLVTWCSALLVLLARPPNLAGAVLHWALVSMAVIVVMAWSYIPPEGWWPAVSRTIFFISYSSVMATALFFTTLFPKPKWGNPLLKSAIIFLPMIVLTAGMIVHHLRAIAWRSIESYNAFEKFDGPFHVVALAYLGAMVFSLCHSYIRATTSEERKKLLWILWGISAGPAPFFLLTTLTTLFVPGGLVSESYTIVFLVFIPIAFGISFVKYRALDVELVISRTTAYGVVLTLLLAIYVGITAIVASKVDEATASVAATILVAILFEPARRRVQSFVDRKFFRVTYNFRNALRSTSQDLSLASDTSHVATIIVHHLASAIPVSFLAVLQLAEETTEDRILATDGQTDATSLLAAAELVRKGALTIAEGIPLCPDNAIEPGVTHQPLPAQLADRHAALLALPLRSSSGIVHALLLAGRKKSGQRFSIEDIDLFASVASAGGAEWDRIELQQKLMREEAERQRLAELNQTKSEFVSYVSHELKTPLTSIKLFSELLRTRVPAADGKSHEFLNTIEGEADRLNRMVSTILDSTRIERGVKQYTFTTVDFGEIVSGVMSTMRYQLTRAGFAVAYEAPPQRIAIVADADAVAEALMNLISNAIKYSDDVKVVQVAVADDGCRASCAVTDRGRGIAPEFVPHIFDKFYRLPTLARHIEGMGIGLSLVKHIVDAHGGTIDVRSTPGKGSTFTLVFPHTPPPTHDREATS
jgi:signal transduction histidine kinase